MGFAVAFFPPDCGGFCFGDGRAQRSLTHCRRRNFMDGGGFAALLAQEAVFRADREAGIIEQLLTSPHSLIAVAFGKAAAHWLYTGAPLTLLCPLVALLAQQAALWTLTAAMALGSMCLVCWLFLSRRCPAKTARWRLLSLCRFACRF